MPRKLVNIGVKFLKTLPASKVVGIRRFNTSHLYFITTCAVTVIILRLDYVGKRDDHILRPPTKLFPHGNKAINNIDSRDIRGQKSKQCLSYVLS